MSNRAGWGDNESAARTSPSRTRASTTDSRGKPPATSSPKRKRRAPGTGQASTSLQMSDPLSSAMSVADEEPSMTGALMAPPSAKKSRTNTPWTAAEEQRLKIMRDAGNSWAEIAKSFPSRTEGSVKKHWYKDMHYAEFAEDEVCASPRARGVISDATIVAGSSERHQRIRNQQVEGDWQESWQACQGVRAVCQREFRWQGVELENDTFPGPLGRPSRREAMGFIPLA
ncbi:hypothetical protein PZA11_000319 [Diplocarpon coronariae]